MDNQGPKDETVTVRMVPETDTKIEPQVTFGAGYRCGYLEGVKDAITILALAMFLAAGFSFFIRKD